MSEHCFTIDKRTIYSVETVTDEKVLVDHLINRCNNSTEAKRKYLSAIYNFSTSRFLIIVTPNKTL